MKDIAKAIGAIGFGALGIWAHTVGIGGFWFWVLMVLCVL